MTPLTTPAIAFTSLFCAALEHRGVISAGASIPDVIETLRYPREVLSRLAQEQRPCLDTLWGFHHEILRHECPPEEFPSEVEAVFRDGFLDRSLSEEELVRRYFDGIVEVLARGVSIFCEKRPEVSWQDVWEFEKCGRGERESYLKVKAGLGLARAGVGERAISILEEYPVEALRVIKSMLVNVNLRKEEWWVLPLIKGLVPKADLIEGIKFSRDFRRDQEALSNHIHYLASSLGKFRHDRDVGRLLEGLVQSSMAIQDPELRSVRLLDIATALIRAGLRERGVLILEKSAEAAGQIKWEEHRLRTLVRIAKRLLGAGERDRAVSILEEVVGLVGRIEDDFWRGSSFEFLAGRALNFALKNKMPTIWQGIIRLTVGSRYPDSTARDLSKSFEKLPTSLLNEVVVFLFAAGQGEEGAAEKLRDPYYLRQVLDVFHSSLAPSKK